MARRSPAAGRPKAVWPPGRDLRAACRGSPGCVACRADAPYQRVLLMPEPTILPLTADPGDPDRLALDREEPRAAPDAAGRNTGVVIGRDALGNVFVTGDGNTVEV